jgi:hypothetical protein
MPGRSGRSEIVDVDTGWSDLLAEVRKLDGAGVLVGLLQDVGSEMTDEGVTVAGYAAINEFGSNDGRIPERSFLRSTVAENERRYVSELVEAAGQVIDGKASVDQAFGLVGLGAELDVKDKIRDLRAPPNAPMTLAKKFPGDNPLIDTGRMRQGISHQVVHDKPAGGSGGGA